jgi:aspartyl-tRNA(Asn)/glutamyl-tRNA(Gln) amidotransferase subunit A
VDVLKSLGCEVRDISLPHTEVRDCFVLHHLHRRGQRESGALRRRAVHLRSAHAGTLTDMYRNTRGEGFGAECKRRIMLGTYVLSTGYYDAYYLKAQKVRALVARDFSDAFGEVDAIVTPVSPFPAFKLGEKLDDPLEMYLSDIYTITGSLAGVPCMSVPCGNTAAGLPVGMQILTRHFDEAGMFRLAGAFEKASISPSSSSSSREGKEPLPPSRITSCRCWRDTRAGYCIACVPLPTRCCTANWANLMKSTWFRSPARAIFRAT